jgi:uncharacterized FlaG/YvyC family protein
MKLKVRNARRKYVVTSKKLKKTKKSKKKKLAKKAKKLKKKLKKLKSRSECAYHRYLP